MSLFDYAEIEEPNVTPSMKVKPPDNPSKTAGYVGSDPHRGRVYVSPRRRDEHYFHLYDGYAVSTSILKYLNRFEVKTVFIEEEEGRTIEYDIAQFLHGEIINFSDHDRQRVVPVDKAKKVWE